MTDEHIFMMGQFEAKIPCDRFYSDSHLWLCRHGENCRVGFTAYSVRLLQDVYFLDWHVDEQSAVKQKQEIGEIESSKALSSLYSPYDGRLIAFNSDLLDDPSAINTDNYGGGWLFEIAVAADVKLLSAAEYLAVLDEGWENTQRHIKGQLN